MSSIISLSDLFESYKIWVSRNPQSTTDFEITAKWVSYIVAGRINSSHILSELVYCLSNLLVLYNDRIICNLRQIDLLKSGEQLKVWLTVIEYSEVFLELSAANLWGEKGRWLVIHAIQIFKCISKLILVYHYKEPIIQSPVIPVLERKNLEHIDKNFEPSGDLNSLKFVSFELKQSGRIIRKVEASPPISLRSWKPMRKRDTEFCDNEQILEQALIERKLVAETIYILKPLAHLSSELYFGRNTWKPYILSLVLDLCSLQLYNSCRNTQISSLTQKQRLQISRRRINLLLYLIRSPFYNKYSREIINDFLNSLSKKVPLASLICSPLIQYLPFWQGNYFYMWSA